MIPEIIPVKNYSGNDVTTKFDFDFYIENENQLVVYHTNKDGEQTLLELGKDYAINEVGQENGSFITFPITGSDYPILQSESSYGVGDAEKISLCLYLPISQETEYGTSDKLDQKSLEYSLDYLTRLIQILNRQMERSVKVPEGAGQTADDVIEVLQQAQIKASENASLAESSATQSAQSAEKTEENYNKSVEILAQIEQTGIDNKANRNLDNIDWNNLDQRAKDSLGATIKTYHNVVYGVAKTVAFGGDYANFTAIDISSYADGTYYIYQVDTTDEETQEVTSSISITTTASDTALQLAQIKIADGALSEVLTSLQYTSENPLQEVIEHTESSAKDIDYDETGKLNLVPFNFAGLNYSDYAKVTANTVSTYSKSGKFFASSMTTVKYRYAGDTTFFDIPYAQEIDVCAGDSINSPVAGRMVFYY